jgi:hypothetical protein
MASTAQRPFLQRSMPFVWLLLLLGGPGGTAFADGDPASLASKEADADESAFQTQLAELRRKYEQERQTLKERSSQLPPQERMRLHKALLDSHRTAIERLEADNRSRSSDSRARWQKRRSERVERLDEVRKEKTARKKHHKQDHD